MTANIARTASRALADALQPYLLSIANKGLAGALQDDPGFGEGIYLYRGQMVNRQLAALLGIEAVPLNELTGGG
jgi:alanine dehydrogenase